MFVNILIINICYHDNPHACKGTRRVLFFYATCRSAISWDVPVLNQCTSDKKMLIFSNISLVSLCLFSMPVPLVALRPLATTSAAYNWVHELNYVDTSSIRGWPALEVLLPSNSSNVKNLVIILYKSCELVPDRIWRT